MLCRQIFWHLSKIASIRCLVLLNQYDGPLLLRQRKSQVLIFKKHKNNCYILKIICFRPFCSNVYVCCVQCLGNVVVWWCAGNIALYRWESWLDVWGNVARAADCRPVPTATPAMRAWWLRTRSSLAWLMAFCLHPAASLMNYHCGDVRRVKIANISVLQ